jgi:hypothetical protein
MNAFDRSLISLALLLAVVGTLALYVQGQQAQREAVQKSQLQQILAQGAL